MQAPEMLIHCCIGCLPLGVGTRPACLSTLSPDCPVCFNSGIFIPFQGSDKQSEVRIKKFMTMMDSMTEKELNTNDIKLLQQPTRAARISRGAGRTIHDYFELLGELLTSFSSVDMSHACTPVSTYLPCRKVPYKCLK